MSNTRVIPILRTVRGTPVRPLPIPGVVRVPPVYTTYSTYQDRTNYSVRGTLKINGVVGKRRVSILFRDSLRLIDSVFSNEVTGEFRFDNLNKEYRYIVIADDSDQVYNAVVADWVIINI